MSSQIECIWGEIILEKTFVNINSVRNGQTHDLQIERKLKRQTKNSNTRGPDN